MSADGVVEVPLTQGYVALIDADDAERILAHRWFTHKCSSGRYVSAVRHGDGDGERKIVRLHREIINAPDGIGVDHINGNPLDNRKSNLRLANQHENIANSRKRKGSSSKYKGVWPQPKSKRWRANITVNYKRIHLGYFEVEEDAARAYDAAAVKYFGEFARLNFPREASAQSA